MCAGCAIAAAAGASGTRSWLAAYAPHWMTPRRMKAATTILLVMAGLVSSVGIGGSSAPASARSGAAHAGASQRR